MRYTVIIDVDDVTKEMKFIECTSTEIVKELKFPTKWGERAKAALALWVQHRSKRGGVVDQQSLVNMHAENPRHFVALVDRAVLNDWAALFETVAIAPPSKPSMAVANQSKTIESVMQILQEAGHEVRRA